MVSDCKITKNNYHSSLSDNFCAFSDFIFKKTALILQLEKTIMKAYFAELKKEGAIVSPVRCKWEPAAK